MILESGSIALVFHRRLFDRDSPRCFIGTVDAYEHGVARITGYTWLTDRIGGSLFKKSDLRTKIVSLSAGTLIVYQLPTSTDLTNIKFENVGGKLILSDRGELKMDLSEIAAAPTRKR
jgi:hypothetical protein